MQGNLWNCLTNGDILRESGIRGQCTTESESITENLYENMSNKFSATLTAAQADAFNAIVNIASMVTCEAHDRGIAEGLMLARELRSVLDNPADAMRNGSSLLNSPYEVNKNEISTLDEYFKATRRQMEA